MPPDDSRGGAGPPDDGPARRVDAPWVQTLVRRLSACPGRSVRESLAPPRTEGRHGATSEVPADRATGVGGVAPRWTSEPFRAEVKEGWGTGHDPPRPARGSVRFWPRAFLASLARDEGRATRQVQAGEPIRSSGHPRRRPQGRHRRRVAGTGARFAEGLTSQQIDHLLAA